MVSAVCALDFPASASSLWALIQHGQWQQAEAHLRELCAEDPNDPTHLHLLALCKAEQGQLESAEALLDKLTHQAPEFAEAHLNLGVVLTRLGRFEPALNSFRQALEVNPDYAQASLYLAETLSLLGQDSAEGYQALLAEHPESAVIWASYAASCFNQEHYEQALEAAQKALALHPQDSRAGLLAALAYQHLGQLSQAIAQIQSLPPSALHVGFLAQWLHQDGRTEQAIALLPASTTAPRLASLRRQLCLSQGRWAEAWHDSPIPPWPASGECLELIAAEPSEALAMSRFFEPLLALGLKLELALPQPWQRLVAARFPEIRLISSPHHSGLSCQVMDLPWRLGFQGQYPLSLWTVPPFTAARLKPHLPQLKPWALALGQWQAGQLLAQPELASCHQYLADWFWDLSRDSGLSALLGKQPDVADWAVVLSAATAVVANDNTLAHLAVGLGKPVVLLSASAPHWVWSSGFYPKVVVVRIDHPGWTERLNQAMSQLHPVAEKTVDAPSSSLGLTPSASAVSPAKPEPEPAVLPATQLGGDNRWRIGWALTEPMPSLPSPWWLEPLHQPEQVAGCVLLCADIEPWLSAAKEAAVPVVAATELARQLSYVELWPELARSTPDQPRQWCQPQRGPQPDLPHPYTPLQLARLALRHAQADHFDEAQKWLDRAIAAEAPVVEIVQSQAVLALRQHGLGVAEAHYRRLCQLEPQIQRYSELGVLLAQANRFEEAQPVLEQAVSMEGSAEHREAAWNNLGNVHYMQKRYAAAWECYQHALELGPKTHDAFGNGALALLKLGRDQEALALYQRALAQGLNQLMGAYWTALNKVHDYEQVVKLAAAQPPQEPIDQIELGRAFAGLYRFDQAAAVLEPLCRQWPQHKEAQLALASLYQDQNRCQEALAVYGRLEEQWPNDPEVSFNRAFALLLSGQLEQGFEHYRTRFEGRYSDYQRQFAAPTWQGQEVSGKRVLVWLEQGMGDLLQNLRFVPWFKQHGASHVVLECHRPLEALLRQQQGIDEVVVLGQGLPPVDYQVSIMELPRLFHVDLAQLPATALPYLKLQQAPWVWPELQGKKVGLVWAGNQQHPADHQRSLSFDLISQLDGVAGINYFSLQVGRTEAVQWPAQWRDLSSQLNDFSDTASALAGLDLLISADTALVHLAGALKLPCWVMVSFNPDWRWLLDREDSPWYPSVRVFRQSQPGQWQGVITQVRQQLQALAAL